MRPWSSNSKTLDFGDQEKEFLLGVLLRIVTFLFCQVMMCKFFFPFTRLLICEY